MPPLMPRLKAFEAPQQVLTRRGTPRRTGRAACRSLQPWALSVPPSSLCVLPLLSPLLLAGTTLVAVRDGMSFLVPTRRTTLVALRDGMSFLVPTRSPKVYWTAPDSCDSLFGIMCDGDGNVGAMCEGEYERVTSGSCLSAGGSCNSLFGVMCDRDGNVVSLSQWAAASCHREFSLPLFAVTTLLVPTSFPHLAYPNPRSAFLCSLPLPFPPDLPQPSPPPLLPPP
ncbi:unnamed protein product [Closterium sp. Naga37s-1]|nr:unnamed protein product [Closterium sp. Naga37s-1]